MSKLITKLHTILNEIKGFNAGVSSSTNDSMVVEYEGEYYILNLSKVDPIAVTENMRKKYKCEDNCIIILELLKRISKK